MALVVQKDSVFVTADMSCVLEAKQMASAGLGRARGDAVQKMVPTFPGGMEPTQPMGSAGPASDATLLAALSVPGTQSSQRLGEKLSCRRKNHQRGK